MITARPAAAAFDSRAASERQLNIEGSRSSMRLARNRVRDLHRDTGTRGRSLDGNGDWRSRLEEADRRIRSLRRTVRIETEIIQSPEADGVRVLVLRKGLRAPAQSLAGLTRRPGRIAIPRAVEGSIVCKCRRILRSMKPQVAHRDSASQRHAERLNRAIKILIIDGVLVMPDSSAWVRHFEAKEPNAIDSRNGLDPVDGRSSPSIDGRAHSHCGGNRGKTETRRTGDTELTVGDVVVHVALPRVSLAPGVYLRSYVLSFGVIRRARIHRRVQVVAFHENPVRCASVNVARVVVCSRWEDAGKGIHPGARTQLVLIRI
jgi:hypothetical protein